MSALTDFAPAIRLSRNRPQNTVPVSTGLATERIQARSLFQAVHRPGLPVTRWVNSNHCFFFGRLEQYQLLSLIKPTANCRF